MFTVLVIGDVVGSIGCAFLREKLPGIKKLMGVNLVIANGENSADGNGMTPSSCRYLLDSGVDVITGGNHSFRRRQIFDTLDQSEVILRPGNFPARTTPGKGFCIVDLGKTRAMVINLIGTAFMENIRDPFETLEEILSSEDLPKIKILDFHAEATGEKRAMGYFADGRLSAVFGTHTHVPTADACVLPHGTGYLTDAGMTGPAESVLGVKPGLIIKRYREKLPVKFVVAEGPCRMDCGVFTVNEKTGLCESAERFSVQ